MVGADYKGNSARPFTRRRLMISSIPTELPRIHERKLPA